MTRFLPWVLVLGLAPAAFAQPGRPYFTLFQQGRTQLLRGEPAAALESFNQSLARAPRFGPALLGRARAALWLREPETALPDLEASSSLPATGRDASLLLAEALIHLNRSEEARTVLQGLGDEPAARLLLLSLEASDRVLKVELGRHLDVPEGFLALGVLALRAGSAQRADPLFRIAAGMDPENPMPALFLPGLAAPYDLPARLASIQEAEQRGDRWTAMKEYRRLLEWIPGLPVLLVRASWQALAMGASELAERLALDAVEALPNDAEVRFLVASVQAASGRADEAVESCRMAIGLGLREARVYLTLGNLLQDKMQVPEALDAYAEGLRLEPSVAEEIPSFSLSALLTGDYAGVRERLRSFVETHPESPETLYALGTASLRGGELEQAEAYFQEMARVAPESSQAFYNLGLVRARLGHEEASRVAMERFRELKAHEDDEFERHNHAHFRRLEAEEAATKGKTQQAAEIYVDLIGERLAEPGDFLALGHLWRQAGDTEKAFSWFEKALELSPYDPEALDGLAGAAQGLGRPEVVESCRERLALLAL